MLKKIVIIGPESTGKSTLSGQLAEHYGTHWVPEFAREYIDNLTRPYQENDLLEIAKGQIESEALFAKQAAQNLLFCDTDLYVIKVWSEHKYNRCHPWILEQIARRLYDCYILTDIDMSWQPDPQREHPQPEMRQYFFNIYKDIVQQSGIPFVIVSGDEKTRLATAVNAINNLIKTNPDL